MKSPTLTGFDASDIINIGTEYKAGDTVGNEDRNLSVGHYEDYANTAVMRISKPYFSLISILVVGIASILTTNQLDALRVRDEWPPTAFVAGQAAPTRIAISTLFPNTETKALRSAWRATRPEIVLTVNEPVSRADESPLGIDLAIANVEPPKQDSVLVGDLGARLQVIYLEIRRDSSTTLLGKAQWLWLEGELSKPANLRLILSRLPVLADKVGWGAFPAERQRLFSLIAKTQATGVVFISEALDGGAIYREGRGVPAAMFELSASASMLADPDFPDLDPNRLGSLARSPTFGLIDIDWTHRTAQLALHALDGQTLEPVASVPLTTTHPSVLALAVTVPGG